MDFKRLLTAVFGFLNITAFTKVDGKSQLTADEEKALKEKFGEKFLNSFKEELADAEANGVDLTIPSVEIAALGTQLQTINGQLKTALDKIKTLEDEKAKLEIAEDDDQPEKIDMEQGKGKRVAFKPDMNLKHNKVIADFFKTGVMQYSGDDTIDTSELQKEFGKYVHDVKIDILTSLKQELTITQYMTTVPTDKTEWRASQAIIDSVLQQFTPKWTPKGKTTFTPIVIKNFKLKVNVPITPSDIMDQYIGYLYDENLSPEQMPIVKYIVDVLIIPQLGEDLENVMCTGKFVERAKTQDGVAGSDTEESMDGVVTVLEALKAKEGNKVGWLLNGVTLTPSNIVDEMNAAADAVSPKYKRKKMLIHADPDLILMYQRAYQAKYPITKNQDAGNLRLDFTNFTFAPVDGLIGTGIFFITPKQNFIHLVSRSVTETKVFMQLLNYDVKIFMEFWRGVGFAMQEAIFAYLPPAEEGSGSEGSGSEGSGSEGSGSEGSGSLGSESGGV
jgi:hypothetical protein